MTTERQRANLRRQRETPTEPGEVAFGRHENAEVDARLCNPEGHAT